MCIAEFLNIKVGVLLYIVMGIGLGRPCWRTFCHWKHIIGSITVKCVFYSAFLLHPTGSTSTSSSILAGIRWVPVNPHPRAANWERIAICKLHAPPVSEPVRRRRWLLLLAAPYAEAVKRSDCIWVCGRRRIVRDRRSGVCVSGLVATGKVIWWMVHDL